MAPRNGGRPTATQSGPEVKRVLECAIPRLNENQNLERLLESAVVGSWADLMRGAHSGLIHIEYGFAPSRTLHYRQVRSSITRGHWLLACAYWMSASEFHDKGVKLPQWISIGRSGAHSGSCDATPEPIRSSPKPRPTRIAPDHNAHGRGEHSGSRVGERGLRLRQVSTRRAHTSLNSA
jgi:hypothetical protein